MNRTTTLLVHPATVSILAAAGFLLAVNAQGAEPVPHLSITQPGGMPGLPVVTSVLRGSTNVTVTWDGPPGYYRLLQQVGLTGGSWQAVGAPNSTRHATVETVASNGFFRVSGPSPQYAGAQVCVECHEGIHTSELDTRHARAFETLRKKNEHQNPQCLPCHTVGFDLPTGFKNESETPHLMGVQCENCHGPAANHAANDSDFTVRPRVELAAQVCGGCHSVSHFPTYQEWTASGHAKVTEDMNPPNRISSCGRCHSGSARLSLLKGKPLPAGDANVEITCAVCHDPHANHVWTNVLSGVVTTNLLRNPVASTNDFFLRTADDFTAVYNPSINLCAQCHNHRGASWTSSSRPPHHSPQYNIMLGTVGELPTGAVSVGPSTHATSIEKQCVGCHMPTDGAGPGQPPSLPHHAFKADSFASCQRCHPDPEGLVNFTRWVIDSQIRDARLLLDRWAREKAPAAIQKYGNLAWEYDNAGELSSPDGDLRGPVASSDPAVDEQKYIPDSIKKARYNLYLVLHDGSYGVHNPLHAIALLEAAEAWVGQELAR